MTAAAITATASPRPPNRRAIRQVMRKMNPIRGEPISITVRKYGSQVIAMCHHPAFSPRAMAPSTTNPAAVPPAKVPAMRRGVARARTATTMNTTR